MSQMHVDNSSPRYSHLELDVEVEDLGLVDYAEALEYQKSCVTRVIAGGKQKLIFCEHPLTITLGRMTQAENILFSAEELKKIDAAVYSVDRGGDVTLHAPGQLVVYPILNLNFCKRDLHWYIRKLEQVAIDLLRGFDILAERSLGRTGVWVGEQKIASLGIGVKKWVSYHGIAVNVNTNLEHFSLIRPCGLDVRMTSMQEIKGCALDMAEVKNRFVQCFVEDFGKELE